MSSATLDARPDALDAKMLDTALSETFGCRVIGFSAGAYATRGVVAIRLHNGQVIGASVWRGDGARVHIRPEATLAGIARIELSPEIADTLTPVEGIYDTASDRRRASAWRRRGARLFARRERARNLPPGTQIAIRGWVGAWVPVSGDHIRQVSSGEVFRCPGWRDRNWIVVATPASALSGRLGDALS